MESTAAEEGAQECLVEAAGLQVEEKDLTDTREPRPDGGGWWATHTWALVFWVVRTACAKALKGNLPGMPEG